MCTPGKKSDENSRRLAVVSMVERKLCEEFYYFVSQKRCRLKKVGPEPSTSIEHDHVT